MRITSKGQVTIPQAIRERAGFLPGTEVEFRLSEDGSVRLERPREPGRAARWLQPSPGCAARRAGGSAPRRSWP